jgi:hypothetical protein
LAIVVAVLHIARQCRVLALATVVVAACGLQPEISDVELEWCTRGDSGIGLVAAQELGRAEEYVEARREWAMHGFRSRIAFYESSSVAKAACQHAYDRAAAGQPLNPAPTALPEVVRWFHYHMEAVLAAAHDLGYGDDIGAYGVDFTSSCSEAFTASGLAMSSVSSSSCWCCCSEAEGSGTGHSATAFPRALKPSSRAPIR